MAGAAAAACGGSIVRAASSISTALEGGGVGGPVIFFNQLLIYGQLYSSDEIDSWSRQRTRSLQGQVQGHEDGVRALVDAH